MYFEMKKNNTMCLVCQRSAALTTVHQNTNVPNIVSYVGGILKTPQTPNTADNSSSTRSATTVLVVCFEFRGFEDNALRAKIIV